MRLCDDMRQKALALPVTILITLLLWQGCSKDEPSPGPENNLAPTSPSNPRPASNATGQLRILTLQWSPSTDPENDPVTYEIYLGTSIDPPSVAAGHPDTTFTTDTLASGTTYYWRVAARDNHGYATSGPLWSFTIGASPSVPLLCAPPNRATQQPTALILRWAASGGATSYALQVSRNSAFSDLVYDGSGLTDTNRQVAGLDSTHAYFWRVNATSVYGISPWSTVWVFTIVAGGGGFLCPGTPPVLYAGKMYHTVQIGTQCWLKENLDVGTMIQGSQDPTNNGVIEKYCYGDDTANCAIYGALYQWREAMRYDYIPGSQGICPPGWHFPSMAEFQTLSDIAGGNGNALKAMGEGHSGGAGTNATGFSALLAGWRTYAGSFTDLGTMTGIWISEFGDLGPRRMELYGSDSQIQLGNTFDTYYGFAVRCLKDG